MTVDSLRNSLTKRRQAINSCINLLCLGAMLLALAAIGSILWTLISQGLSAFGSGIFLNDTLPPGSGGGLRNAIVGSLFQTAIGVAIGAPCGLLAGTWLAEMAGGSRLAVVVRFLSDILLSAPSILIGMLVYYLIVLPTGGFSGLAGGIALAMIIIPIVARTSEDSLRMLPVPLREAAYALGALRWQVVVMVCWRAVRAGILTGFLLGTARISGEAAPLLFTSIGNTGWSLDLLQPMASLPVVIYQYAGSAFDDWVATAWAGALLVVGAVFALNILSRWLTGWR